MGAHQQKREQSSDDEDLGHEHESSLRTAN
jgi:hypothetical protein